MKALIFFTLQTLLLWLESEGFDLGSIIPLCSVKDPKLNECVKASAQKLVPLLKDGVPEWNFPPLDPYTTPTASFKGSTPEVEIDISYKNVEQLGFSNVIIEGAEMDLANGKMSFKLKYPIFTFIADYSSKGHIFDFTVEGNGKANITVWDCISVFTSKFHIADDHLVQDSYAVDYSFDKIFMDYSNVMINGDKELSESAGTFINENSAEILKGFKPELEKFYGDINGNIVKKLLEAVPYSSLFKDV